MAVYIEVMQAAWGSREATKIMEERITEFLPADKFSIIPIDKSMQQLAYWREDNSIPTDNYMTTRTPREGLIAATEKLGGADYIVSIILTSDTPQFGASIFTVNQRQTVVLDFRIMDPATSEYLSSFKAEGSERGNTSAMNTVGNTTIYLKAVRSAISNLKLDVSGL